MSCRILAAICLSAGLLAPIGARASVVDILVDDFEDGAFSIQATGLGAMIAQTDLDPGHVIGGNRTVKLSAGLPFEPISASLSLSSAGDALSFVTSSTFVSSSVMSIGWELPDGIPAPAPGGAVLVLVDAPEKNSQGEYVVPSLSFATATTWGGAAGLVDRWEGTLVYKLKLDQASLSELRSMWLSVDRGYSPLEASYSIGAVRFQLTPEPSVAILLGTGFIGVGLHARRSRQA